MRISRSSTAGTGTAQARSATAALVLPTFAVTLFLSALLIFVVQPMFAKMVLPSLGGSPAVWSVAMCFFQIVLLAGYAYAHGLIRFLRPERGVIVHLTVLIAAMVGLPLAVSAGWGEPPADGLHVWVIGLFAVSVGLPFFALSANAPLLQAWFARTGHAHAADPYFLYGASNIGSLLALLAYPVLLEPSLTLGAQSALWSTGYKLLVLCVGASALLMLVRASNRAPRPTGGGEAAAGPGEGARIGLADKLSWLALAFVPSGLLVAVTSHITTDVAAAPFLWVLPLSLFLLTFVITFQRRPVLPHRAVLAVQPVAVAALILSMQFPLGSHWPLFLALHLAAFFVSAMVCHGELVHRRPRAGDLTQFYLWMSLGGALGGLFTGLIAPYVFDTVAEYPLMVVLALAARPGFWPMRRRALVRAGALAAVLLVAAVGPKLLMGLEVVQEIPRFYIAAFTVFVVAMVLSRAAPLRLAAVASAALVAGHVLTPENAKGENHRGFFGVNKVIETSDGKFRLLKHGTTLHGAQRLGAVAEAGPPEPLTYYHRASPFADVLAALRRDRALRHIGVVGLGTGSLACYRQAAESWRFFEIDPIVARLAQDRSRFRFLSDCAPDADIVIGDARLTLTREPDQRYDLLVLDAFSSDAIPVHLLTREAVEGYLAKLAPGGVLAFHVSNRNMDLVPVLSAIKRDLGLTGLTRHGGAAGKIEESYKSPATMVALARRQDQLARLATADGWHALPKPAARVWTDDYSNVLGAILAQLRAASPRGSQK